MSRIVQPVQLVGICQSSSARPTRVSANRVYSSAARAMAVWWSNRESWTVASSATCVGMAVSSESKVVGEHADSPFELPRIALSAGVIGQLSVDEAPDDR